MSLLRTSIFGLIATVIRMLSALVINKAVAIYIGPTGLALIGQFQNFTQITLTFAQGAINTGVVKYAAEYGSNNERFSALLSTSVRISMLSAICVGLIIIGFAEAISLQVLKSRDYTYVIVLLGTFITLTVLNNLLLSILNGLREIKTWVLINIIQSLYSLVFVSILIYFFSLHGALVALVTNQAVVLLVVMWMLRHHPSIKLSAFKQKFCTREAKKLINYAAMAITTAATIPMTQLIVRQYLGNSVGWDEAGYLQAIWYISNIYLTVATTTLSIYYLPRLSEIRDKTELRTELINGYRIIMPIVIILASCVYFTKDIIIYILFSDEFKPMSTLFLWQLVGDVIKLASFLLAHLMIAKAMTKTYIFTEIMFGILYTALSVCMISVYGLVGATYAYGICYGAYFIAMIPATRKVRF